MNPSELQRVKAEICRKSFYAFVEEFWPEVSASEFVSNWHIHVFCEELAILAERVGKNLPKEYDLIVNVPPGTTKTIIFSIMFPAWCWTNWHWMRFITASYSSPLSLESAEYSRDLVRSDRFIGLFPNITIKSDKDTKGNFRVQMKDEQGVIRLGGNRYSTSVGGTLTGFHGHINIVDDPLNPAQAASDTELKTARNWMDRTLSTRKVDKRVTPTVLIMQRLSEGDPSGHWLSKKKKNLRHICLPGEIREYMDSLAPPELKKHYIDDLLDPTRMGWDVLEEMKADLGQYGYSGQVGQSPFPIGGGIFKIDQFKISDGIPNYSRVIGAVRYWDKAGTDAADNAMSAFTAGVLMFKLRDGNYFIADVVRGQWSAGKREAIIRQTAEIDRALYDSQAGSKHWLSRYYQVWTEQEPGSGGKESAENTIRNLAGFVVRADKVTGDKIIRAGPYAVQVENGNVIIKAASWTTEFIAEHEKAPTGMWKDQWDAAAGAFNKLSMIKFAGTWGR